jgi:excisionase family DNA binding protein
VGEAAALLGVNVKTLYAEINANRFPAIRLGRVIRISRAVVTAILEQGRVSMAGPKASLPTKRTSRRF